MKTIVLVTPPFVDGAIFDGLSADGRYVAYEPGNRSIDEVQYFLKDTQTGVIQTVATASSDFPLFSDLLSANGQYVAYSTLNESSDNVISSINVFDGATGATTVIAPEPDPSTDASAEVPTALSPDGQSLFFASGFPDLTGSENLFDLFQVNVQTGSIQKILVGWEGGLGFTGGRYFSALAGDATTGFDLYRVDTTNGNVDGIATFDTLEDAHDALADVNFSDDGRFAVITTRQALLPSDTNGAYDIYRKDLSTGALQLISETAAGTPGNADSFDAAISADGSEIVFATAAPNLSPGATEQSEHIVIWDAATGTLNFLADGDSNFSISADGKTVAVQTGDPLVAGDTDNASDVYLIHLTHPVLTIDPVSVNGYINAAEGPTITISGTSDAIGQTVLISVPNTQTTANAVVQADGTWKVFLYTGGFTDGAYDIHAVVSDGLTTDADRSFIVDRTPPTDLSIISVAGDNIINAAEISHATITGTVQIADPTGAGTDSGSLTISIDGGGSKTFVTQPSGSLVDADFSQVLNASGVTDGEHTITLTATDPAGNTTTVTKQVLVDTTPPKIAITSISGDDVINPTELKTAQGIHGTSDAFGQTVTVSLNGNAVAQAVVQADGTWITTADFSAANSGENLVTAQVDDEAGNPGSASAGVYVDRGFTPTQLSVGPAGQQGGGSGVLFPALDAAGDKLVFTGLNFNLMSTATGSSGAQVYVKDLTTGAITFATPDSSENAEFASISPDGRYIEFVSDANLDPADQAGTGNPPGYYLTYTEDLTTNAIYFHSLSDDAYDGTDPDTLHPGITPGYYALGNYADGTPIQSLPVFPLAIADGGNGLELIDDLEPDQVVQPLVMTTGIRLDVNYVDTDGNRFFSGAYTAPDASPPEDNPYGRFVLQEYAPQISADGSVVAFEARFFGEQWDTSGYPPVVTIQPPTLPEIYAGPAPPDDEEGNDPVQELASSYADGTPMPFGAIDPALSADGKFVAFWSWNNDDQPEVYVKNLTTGELDIASSDTLGNPGVGNTAGTFNAGFNTIVISADGRYVAFTSDAILTSDDSGTGADLFIKDMQSGAITRVNLPPGTFANDLSTQLTMTADGGYIAFTTSKGLVFADNNNVNDIYGFSVAALSSTPQITFSPVTGNDQINAAEDSTRVTVSGTSDAIGQTVTLYVDGGFLPGVVVGSGGTWSTTIDTTYLTNGVHQLLATVSTSGGATNAVGDLITVDRIAPTVTLSADNTHLTPGGTAIVTAHFSEGIGNVDPGFLSATGGTLGGLTFVDDHTLTEVFTPTSGATAYSVVANSGDYFDYAGNAGISGASLGLGTPLGSGQTVVVSSGQTGSGHTVLSGGQLVVSSGGSDVNPVLSSGGSEVVSSGGTTIDTAVSSGGTLIVSSGGVGDPTTIHSGGSEVVSGGGTDLGAVISGGKLVDFGITSGVTVFTGGAQIVRSGGVASGTIVSSGGVFSDFGTASGTVVSSAGSDFVQSGGVETGVVLSNGGTEFIEAHGLGSALTLSSGAVLANFGSASGTLISNGGSDFIENGGTETGATLFSGGTEFVEAGGVAIGLTVSNGGLVTKFGSASGTIVDSGGLDFIQAGGSETGATLASGGVEYVEAGGRTTGLTALSGGTVANYGGSESGTIVRSGALDYVEAAGVETGAVLSGGIEYLQAGGTTNNLTVSSGGIVANYGGSESGTLVSNGGLDFVEAAGVETRGTLFSGGIEYIESGATTNNLAVSSGGIAANYGGSASGTITRNGGLDYVEANAVETGGTLSNGGIGYVFASGTMNALMASSGGIFANYGGSASGTIIGNGGTDFVETGGIETGATVSIGGFEYVEAGGETNNLTVSGGGNLIDYGSGSGTIVRNGGTEYVEPGAVETGGIVSSGGVEYVYTGGTVLGLTLSNGGSLALHGSASGTMVSSGGTDFVVVGGTETGATLANGGVAFIEAGGTTFGLTVSGGGIVDNQGGSASGAMISAGGQDYLEAGAVETGATLFTGGAEYIEAGGTASGVTISGGLVDLTSGGVISGTVTFVNSGQLTLADSQHFQGLVAGFSSTATKLDLQDISYASGVTTLSWTQLVGGSNGSGTLTVSGGGHAANITLIGQYATGNFIISGDGGAGGTLVTDPPLMAPDSASTLINSHP